jgi:hypothetical protein
MAAEITGRDSTYVESANGHDRAGFDFTGATIFSNHFTKARPFVLVSLPEG